MVATKTIKSNNKRALPLAAEALKKGGLAVFPTETAYGLGAMATDRKAVERVFEVKGRPRQKSLPVIVDCLSTIERYVRVSGLARRLAKKFMPGPLTLVVRAKNKRLSAVSRKGIAFRIPSNRFARELCSLVGEPVTSTSANPSGTKPFYRATEVKKHFYGKADVIIDAGTLKQVLPSTILDVRKKTPVVIREGPVSTRDVFREIRASERSRAG
jgi:L-threonylcarbamoyladenylate synthase